MKPIVTLNPGQPEVTKVVTPATEETVTITVSRKAAIAIAAFAGGTNEYMLPETEGLYQALVSALKLKHTDIPQVLMSLAAAPRCST
jgi:hypothetical protein